MSTKTPRNDRNKFEKPKSKLFTPDPYYIPGTLPSTALCGQKMASKQAKMTIFSGYCGYCPMKKFQLGDTYGKTTADILTNDDVSKCTVPVPGPDHGCPWTGRPSGKS